MKELPKIHQFFEKTKIRFLLILLPMLISFSCGFIMFIYEMIFHIKLTNNFIPYFAICALSLIFVNSLIILWSDLKRQKFNYKLKLEKMSLSINENHKETLEAKLKNQLSPIYGLADMVLNLDKNPNIKPSMLKLLEKIENKNAAI